MDDSGLLPVGILFCRQGFIFRRSAVESIERAKLPLLLAGKGTPEQNGFISVLVRFATRLKLGYHLEPLSIPSFVDPFQFFSGEAIADLII